MVDDLVVVADQVGERSASGRRPRLDAGRVCGRGVRSHPARGPPPTGSRLSMRGSSAGRQLVEAGERLGVAIGVELLDARHEAVGAEDPEEEGTAFRKRRRRCGRCRSSSTHEQRVGSQVEDVVKAVGDPIGELDQGAQLLRSASAPRWTRSPASGGRRSRRRGMRRGVRSGRRSQQRRDRARRRRGTIALGAVGEELGIALVQPDDGVAESVGGEVLAPPASSRASTSTSLMPPIWSAPSRTHPPFPACLISARPTPEAVAYRHNASESPRTSQGLNREPVPCGARRISERPSDRSASSRP